MGECGLIEGTEIIPEEEDHSDDFKRITLVVVLVILIALIVFGTILY